MKKNTDGDANGGQVEVLNLGVFERVNQINHYERGTCDRVNSRSKQDNVHA